LSAGAVEPLGGDFHGQLKTLDAKRRFSDTADFSTFL